MFDQLLTKYISAETQRANFLPHLSCPQQISANLHPCDHHGLRALVPGSGICFLPCSLPFSTEQLRNPPRRCQAQRDGGWFRGRWLVQRMVSPVELPSEGHPSAVCAGPGPAPLRRQGRAAASRLVPFRERPNSHEKWSPLWPARLCDDPSNPEAIFPLSSPLIPPSHPQADVETWEHTKKCRKCAVFIDCYRDILLQKV